MNDIVIELNNGKSKRLKVKGKVCKCNIVVIAEKIESVDLSPFSDGGGVDNPTTEDHINDLTARKTELAETLQNAEVEASPDEPYSTLVPKVESAINNSYEAGKQASTDDFIGIKYLEVTDDEYKLPIVVDIRTLKIQGENTVTSTPGRFASLFANSGSGWYMGQYTKMRDVYLPDGIFGFGQNMFSQCGELKNIYGDLSNCKTIPYQTFAGCSSLSSLPYMPNLEAIALLAFQNCTSLTSVRIYKKLTSFGKNAFNGCTNLIDIYVPWAEGEVPDAPWGATNATIRYNYTGEVEQ